MSKSKLVLFLDGTGNLTDPDKKRDGRKSEGDKSTHNSMTGGSWAIDDDDLPEFYKLYCEHIRNYGPLHLTEKSTRIGALRVDLDFLYEGIHENHLHTRDQTIDFVKAWMNEFKKYIEVKDVLEVVVMEKSAPTIKGNRSKSGIHLIVPSIKSNRYIEEAVRRTLLPRMGKDFFVGLPLIEDWRKVYDPSPLTHTNNWTLLGSSKKDGTPYQIIYTIDWDSETGDVSIDENVPHAITPDLVRKLSVRSAPGEETPTTEEGKKLVEDLQTNGDDIRISGGRAVQPTRGRPSTREGTQSRGSSPDRMMYLQPLSEALFKYYSAHVFNLGEFRYKTYAEWISVGQCLKNIHPDLESVWLEFSSQDPGQYNPREAMSKWNSFNFRVDGQKLGIGSLRHWSRMDNPDKYVEIEKTNIGRLIEESADSGTEYDVAQVVHAMFRDDFKCARFGSNVWYRWCGHIWRETDRGVALQVLLSSDVRKEYLKKQIECLKMREEGNPCDCTGKESSPNCEYCKMEDRAQRYATMQVKLKTTPFKEKVMKECRELFLDEDFINKLDENKRVIAFNNGVFDTLTLEFRDGRPDDYLSFSTNVDYDPNTPYFAHPCWPEIELFVRSVLPNPKVRDYFVKHLSTCLSGTNDAQKFHIMTGSGSNGKSMLSNLVSTTFGDYSTKVSITLLTQKRGKSGSATPELIKLKGRRFVTMQEPDEEVPLNTGLMKELSSGEKVSARDLYQGSKQMIDFDIQARLHLSCNEKPKINTTDGGTWRRLVVIDFPMKFVEEPKLPNELPIDKSIGYKVVSEEWARCFLSYLVHLYREGNGWRKLVAPTEVMAYTNEYKEDSDSIAKFIREYIQNLDVEPGSSPDPVTKQMLTSSFQEWKRNNEITTRASATELLKRIEGQFGKYPRFGWTSFRLGSS